MKRNIIQLICLAVFYLAGTISANAADVAWPILTFTCDKAKNEVKMKNEVKWGNAGKSFPFSAQSGTYNPWDLISITEHGEYRLLAEKKKLNLTCELGGSLYRFVVRPKIFNTNYNGKCGNRLSVIVSIFKDDAELIKGKEMEKFCHGNTPVLRGIKVKADTDKVKLYEIARSQFY